MFYDWRELQKHEEFERAWFLWTGHKAVFSQPWPDGSLRLRQKLFMQLTMEEYFQWNSVPAWEKNNV